MRMGRNLPNKEARAAMEASSRWTIATGVRKMNGIIGGNGETGFPVMESWDRSKSRLHQLGSIPSPTRIRNQ